MHKWNKSFTIHQLVFTIESICISFDPTVRLINPMMKTSLCMVKDLSRLCVVDLAFIGFRLTNRKECVRVLLALLWRKNVVDFIQFGWWYTRQEQKTELEMDTTLIRKNIYQYIHDCVRSIQFSSYEWLQ
jgi:hypothetical protein